MLYVAVPYLIALGLLVFTRSPAGTGTGSRYVKHMRESMIVLLGTSAVLHEGFLCVLFVIPIYIVISTIAYIFAALFRTATTRKGKVYSSVIPVLLLLSSAEGITPQYTAQTRHEVSANRVIALTPGQIKRNLARSMQITRSDNALLSLFPMPYRIEAGTLRPGDIHRAYYRYDKWIVANSHEGLAEFRITEVSDHDIRMELTQDTSYISHYMDIQGTHISMHPVDANHTDVRLTVIYDRLLSPAWYFGPLQTYAVEKMTELLLKEVIAHE